MPSVLVSFFVYKTHAGGNSNSRIFIVE